MIQHLSIYKDRANVDSELDGSPALKLMHSIAYARNKVIIKASDMDTPTLWNQRQFNDWQLNDFDAWQRRYGSIFSVNPSTVSGTALRCKENYTNWRRGKVNTESYPVFVDEAHFNSWRHSFENQAEMDGFNRLIEDKFADKAAFRSSLTDQYDIMLFDAQHATLL